MSEASLYPTCPPPFPVSHPTHTQRTPLGPYRRPMPRVLGGSWESGRFLMGEVPLNPRDAVCWCAAYRADASALLLQRTHRLA